MISRAGPSWQTELANAFREPLALMRELELPLDTYPATEANGLGFRLRVPRSYVARMRKNDPDDPLLRQVLPLSVEARPAPLFSKDPVGDLTAMQAPGVLHKYQGRVLLVTTGACGIHCRYCFRRHFSYHDANPTRDEWRQALDYIRGDRSITEVILSGGDPLTLTDEKLSLLARRLAEIPHLKRLRLHTRLPTVLPERIDDALLGWLSATPLKTVVVVQVNHANELDSSVASAMQRLAAANTTLLNQSVLLSGVNDDVDTLSTLSDVLFDAGVLPYYLHQLDRVRGAAHFEVKADRARSIMDGLRTHLPGYLVPRLVREVPGLAYKLPI